MIEDPPRNAMSSGAPVGERDTGGPSEVVAEEDGGKKGALGIEYFRLTEEEEEGRRQDSDPLYWPDRWRDMTPSTAFACDLRYPKFQGSTHFVVGLRMCLPTGTVKEVRDYGPRFERQFRDRCAMHAFNNAVHAAGRPDLTLSVDEMIAGRLSCVGWIAR